MVCQIKKEEPSCDDCKGVPMETSSAVGGEDKKPELKMEPKKEEEGSGPAVTPSSVSGVSKKKSMIRPLKSIPGANLLLCDESQMYRIHSDCMPITGNTIPFLLQLNVVVARGYCNIK